MTEATFRRLALALSGAEERAHHDHPDFRVGGWIFATMGFPRRGWAMVRLTPGDQDAFVMMHSAAFVPVKGKWGEQGCTNVILKEARVEPVRAALESAFGIHAAKPPKKAARPAQAKRMSRSSRKRS